MRRPAPRTTTTQREAERLWTVAEVADYLGVSRDTIARWRESGVLPWWRPPGSSTIRIRDSDLRAVIERGMQSTSTDR